VNYRHGRPHVQACVEVLLKLIADADETLRR
jgi:hypothetical protein